MAKIISVINYEGGNDVLIYKHPTTDFNIGSQLVVHESQEAIFFKDGKALDTFGPGRHTLETQNLPIIKNIVNSIANGEHIFTAAVYFVNLTTELGVKWGTDTKIRMFDPVSGLHLELGAFGTFNIKVIDGRKLLLKVVGTTSGFTQEEVFGGVGYSTSSSMGKFKGMIVSKVKSTLAKAIRENDINILEVDEHIDELAEILRGEINKVLDEYGLFLPEFFITSIATPDDDPNFKRLKEQHAERYLKVQEQRIRQAEAEAAQGAELVLSETEAKKKVIAAGGEAEAYKLKAAAEAEEMRMKGYTYGEETARQVGVAAASNESSGGGSIAADVVRAGVGLGVGVAVAGQVVDQVKPVVSGIANPQPSAQPVGDTWDCPNCGAKGLTGKFCLECGTKRPEQQAVETWDCPACGAKGLKGKFCPECGTPRPVDETWDCPECGAKGLKGKFCPNCGHKK